MRACVWRRYDPWVYALFNFFLGLPIIAVGVLDRDVGEASLLRLPGLYYPGLRGLDLNTATLGARMLLAIAHAAIIFFLSLPLMGAKVRPARPPARASARPQRRRRSCGCTRLGSAGLDWA